MLLGVLLGVAAGALWGLIYIAPLAVPEYNPVLVALSRFIAFGVISLPFLWVFRRELKAFTRADIWESFKLPLLGNVLFYCLLTICIRLAGAPLAGMFMAVIPVLVAITSNIRYAGSKSAVAWSKILPPLAVIFFGLIVANLTEFERAAAASAEGGMQYWIGVGFGLAAVVSWTWFSIMNAEWLLNHPKHNAAAWTALQGVTVLPFAACLFGILAGGLDGYRYHADGRCADEVSGRSARHRSALLLGRHDLLEQDEPDSACSLGRTADRVRIRLRGHLCPDVARRNADAVDDDWLHYLDGRRARFASRLPEAHGILDRRYPRTHSQDCGCCQPCRTSGGRHPRQLTAPSSS